MRPNAPWLWLALLGLLAHSGHAMADDWLVALPDCGARATPGVSLVYPRQGLPALVHAGSSLVVRVTQPTALTPPPGIQQPRALAGWSARLTPRAHTVPGTQSTASHAYERVPVTDIRPDGPSSLRYRATLDLPPWLPPASYDLALHTPGGHVALQAAVRVLEPKASVRIARARAPHMGLPFDVVLLDADADAPADPQGGPLVLRPDSAVATLRVGEHVWTLGTCQGSAMPVGQTQRGVPSAFASAQAAEPARMREDGGALRVQADAALPAPAEVTVLADAQRAVAVQGGEIAWFPLGSESQVVVGRLQVAPGETASVRYEPRASTPLSAMLRLPPAAKVGTTARLAVAHAPAGARIAWRVGEREQRFGPPETDHAFRRSGPVDVQALLVTADGRVQRLEGRVNVAGPGGCEGTGCGLALALAIFATKTRRRRRVGIDCRGSGV